jgi:hypothetical protein
LQRSGVLFGGLAGPGDGVVELVVVEVLDLGADEVIGEAGSELGHAMAAARSSFPKTPERKGQEERHEVPRAFPQARDGTLGPPVRA